MCDEAFEVIRKWLHVKENSEHANAEWTGAV